MLGGCLAPFGVPNARVDKNTKIAPNYNIDVINYNEASLMEQPAVGFEAPRWWQRWWGRALIAAGLVILLFFGYVGVLVYKKLPDINSYRDRFTLSGPDLNVPVDLSILIRDGDPTLGPMNAPITIVEFGDFECPYCREAYPVIRSLAAEFGDKLRIIYRHFPVPQIHDKAIAAAEASMCAEEQGKFWPYHDRLFQNQDQLDAASLKQYALRVGLDIDEFNKCFDERKYQELVRRDMTDGKALGVRGTPTWFINGRREEGAIPENVFRKEIERIIRMNSQ